MHVYVRRGLYIALLSGGGILLAAGQASAGESTTGQDSLLGGNQITAPVTVPVTISDTAVAVGGDATAENPADPSTPGTSSPGGDESPPAPGGEPGAPGSDDPPTDGSESDAGGADSTGDVGPDGGSAAPVAGSSSAAAAVPLALAADPTSLAATGFGPLGALPGLVLLMVGLALLGVRRRLAVAVRA